MFKLRRIGWVLLCLMLIGALVLTACPAPTPTPTPTSPRPTASPSPTVLPSPTPTASPSPSPTTTGAPYVSITTPQDNDVLDPGPVEICVDVRNFRSQSKANMPNAPGEGHLHFYFDQEPPTEPGAMPLPGAHISTTFGCYIWADPTPGIHTIYVALGNNDHTLLQPPVISMVTVTVRERSSLPPSPK